MEEEHILIEIIEQEIVTGHNLVRPDPYQMFYIRTDWYKDGMVSVLLQAEDLAEERNSEA